MNMPEGNTDSSRAFQNEPHNREVKSRFHKEVSSRFRKKREYRGNKSRLKRRINHRDNNTESHYEGYRNRGKNRNIRSLGRMNNRRNGKRKENCQNYQQPRNAKSPVLAEVQNYDGFSSQHIVNNGAKYFSLPNESTLFSNSLGATTSLRCQSLPKGQYNYYEYVDKCLPLVQENNSAYISLPIPKDSHIGFRSNNCGKTNAGVPNDVYCPSAVNSASDNELNMDDSEAVTPQINCPRIEYDPLRPAYSPTYSPLRPSYSPTSFRYSLNAFCDYGNDDILADNDAITCSHSSDCDEGESDSKPNRLEYDPYKPTYFDE
mmetsp:Transcript_8719/g.12668  ORF Transcript_8719/g.12668 Transcript_8719/m.12668 type:complete len:318 (+) Transcript_8719:90-1043(+)